MSITEIRSLAEIPLEKYNSTDIVGFDLDDTIFIQRNSIMRNVNVERRNEFIENVRSKALREFPISMIVQNIL